MHCYRILSIFVALLLFLSLAANLVGLWSLNWWEGAFEAIIPLNKVQYNRTEMHWLFHVRFGLTTVCWKALQPRLTNDPDNYEIIQPLEHCSGHKLNLPFTEDGLQEDMTHFRNMLICICVGIIFNVLAFVFAFFKLPCIRKLKKTLMLLTIIMAIIAAICVLVCLFIANDKLSYEAPFMTRLMSTTPNFGTEVTATVTAFLNQVFTVDAFRVGGPISREFEKGWSFIVTCVAEVFLILAIILSIIENCCFHSSRDNEYLIDDDEKKNSHI